MNITRRAFAGGVVGGLASLLLPKLHIRPQYDLHAIANEWCDGRYTRYDLGSPYVMNGHVYATDARGMVRFVDGLATTDGNARIPKQTVEVWESHWRDAGELRRLPSIPTLIYEQHSSRWCPVCARADVECELCQGLGEWCSLPGDKSCVCHRCHGNGFLNRPTCNWCHGDPTLSVPVAVRLGDAFIGTQYYDILKRLPGVMYRDAIDCRSPITFVSEIGIEGILAQMR